MKEMALLFLSYRPFIRFRQRAVLVDLVENDARLARGQPFRKNVFPVGKDIPIQIGWRRLVLIRVQ